MPAAGSRESLVQRALPSFLGLLFAILTIVAVLLLFMVRHVVLVLFVSVLFAAALRGRANGFTGAFACRSGWRRW